MRGDKAAKTTTSFFRQQHRRDENNMSSMFCETCIGVLRHHRHVIGSPTRSSKLDCASKTQPYVEVDTQYKRLRRED